MKHANLFPDNIVGGGQTQQVIKRKPHRISLMSLIVDYLYSWYRISQERRALSSMSDWMLKDIGLSRADAERESQRHFWDIPQ